VNDTWAGVLAISVAIMAIVQVSVLIGLAIAAKRVTAVAQSTQRQVEALAADVKLRVNAVTERVNAVADDVRGVTARVQQVATTVSDGVQRVEQSVKTAGHRVAQTIDQVPPTVKKGVPAGLAILAAFRTVQQVRARMRDRRSEERGFDRSHDPYADPEMYVRT
jgi:uncharacterized protein YoxC